MTRSRRVSDEQLKETRRRASDNYRKNHPDRVKAMRRRNYLQQREERLRYSREYALRPGVKEKKLQSAKLPEAQERQREYWRRKRAEDPEKARESTRRWRENNMAYVLRYASQRHFNNPKIGVALVARRRARLLNCPVNDNFTAADIRKTLLDQQGLCWNPYCLKVIVNEYHVDHVFPVSRGGSNSKRNIQLLCPRCNLQKYDKTMEEFMEYYRRVILPKRQSRLELIG